ncbi:Sporulation kinase A [compost metagenome]
MHLFRRERTLHLCVSDAGCGIDAELLARLGEPFLTTKATGTGLGLAVVKAVVRAHQGTINLRSKAGRGTCVRVELPLIDGQLAEGV